MIKFTLKYENLAEKHPIRTGLVEVGARKKNSLSWLFRPNFDITEERKKEIFLLNSQR